MHNPHLQRALVLLEQSRLDLAEPELRQALAGDPDNGLAHALLARCLVQRDDLHGATDEAKAAIGLDPESAYSYATLAQALSARQHVDDALEAAQEAVRLDPDDADYYALLAMIQIQNRSWTAALDTAQLGLERDAENVGCNNARAMALTKLNRTAEASATLAATLHRAPEDPYSHANLGWTALYDGDREKALEHFREALRLDPTLDYAKAGLVEALKARNPIYGLMLRYFLFMSRLTGQAQWGFVLGAYIAYRVLVNVANSNPTWRPWLRPLIVAYIAFAIMTWISEPLFNLLLRLNRYGRYALSDDQRRGANLIGALALPALIGLVWSLVGPATGPWALLAALYFGLLILPASAIFRCDAGWPRWSMAAYTIAVASLVPLALALQVIGVQSTGPLLQGHVLGCGLSGFLANGLLMSRARR